MDMCPDREILSAYLDGEVGAPWDRAIAEHVDSCSRCRQTYRGLQETRRLLHADPLVGWEEPMERVRRGIIARVSPGAPGAFPPGAPGAFPPVPARVSPLRRKIAVPLPVAALAAFLVLALGISLAVALARANMGFVKVTRAPAGGTEYQFAIPYDKVEALLKSIGGADSSIEAVMTLPRNVKLVPVGEPRMGKETEFPRKKQ
jgi:anti-sigma factor RsiW